VRRRELLCAAVIVTDARAQDPLPLRWSVHDVTVNRSDGGVTVQALRPDGSTGDVSATVAGSEGFSASVTIPAGAPSASVFLPVPEPGSVAPGGYVYFDLADASPTVVDRVVMTVVEDVDTDPRPPTTTITAVGARKITGTATDYNDDLARVMVGVQKREGTRCRPLRKDGSFGKRQACTAFTRLHGSGATAWTFKLKKRLPKGRYVVHARAYDHEGFYDASPAKKAFTVK